MQQIDLSNSLLSRQESEAIKGVLILLIMLGHNIPFVWLTSDFQGMVWLYCFHISAFFILPWLYPHKQLTKKHCLDLAIRYYIPMLWSVLFLTVINLFRGTIHWNNLWRLPLIFVSGGPSLIKTYTNIQFLWFIPAMFFSTLMREVLFSLPRGWKIVFFSLGIAAIIYELSPVYWNVYTIYGFNILVAFKYYTLGTLLRYLCSSFHTFWKPLVLFISTSVAFFYNYIYLIKPYYHGYSYKTTHYLLALILCISFFMLLFHAKSFFSRNRFLKYLGTHSIIIYLTHTYIGYVTFFILFKAKCPLWLSMILCYACMLVGSLAIASIISTNKWHSRLFPKGLSDFYRSWCTPPVNRQ